MERIAGDTLYGGVIGLVSSVANVAFEQVTGKDFGETALELLGVGQDKPTAVAANATAEQSQASRVADGAPVQLMPVATTAVLSSTSQTEVTSVSENGILSSLNRNGIGLDVEPPAPLPVTTSSLDDTNTNALLASLNRNGSGLELDSVAPVTPLVSTATKTSAINDANATALMASLNRDGIGTDLGLRAMYAYRKSLVPPADAPSTNATLH
jgi:hypothetical protein